jgi:RNA polymerase sigma-70 factor (ECF subfamily)
MHSIKEFINKLIKKDNDAWNKFLLFYSKLLTGIAKYYSLPIEDFIQSILEKLLKEDCKILRKFYGNTEIEFKVFIMEIAKNHAKNLIRTQKNHNKEEKELTEISSDNPGPEELAIKQSEMENLKNALKKIKPQYQQVLVLRFIKNYKIKEIAQELNLPDNTVSTYIHRGINELRYFLEEKNL